MLCAWGDYTPVGRHGYNPAVRFQVTLEFDEEGFVVAECPALPGCCSQGRDREEALANIRDAIRLSLLSRRELGLPVPTEVAEVEVSV